ncbi:hypothetical protein [Geomicrobium sp. JCM 19037]|uniref:hypothetical protein n=1 Tax=Geomicrobium sp. JCM 19037 TaxID=1460634 RepID=UPI001EE66D78|nr:hypothetical protein [Geomicrobium sp. JCM 19037]
MPKTIIEKIISNHSKQSVQAGDLTIIDVDATMATDSTAPLAIKSFKEMGGDQSPILTVLCLSSTTLPSSE